jgi:hypothetical protein
MTIAAHTVAASPRDLAPGRVLPQADAPDRGGRMKVALLLVVVSVALCASSARAAAGPYCRIRYEVGGWRWTEIADGPVERGDRQTLVLSVGRWQRLTRGAAEPARSVGY